MPEREAQPQSAVFGRFRFDLSSRELHKDGHTVRLEDKAAQLLSILVSRAGQVVSREELREALWPGDVHLDFQHGLNKTVNKLRAALGDDADEPRFIETLSRRGYRFTAAVELVGNGRHPAPAADSAAAPDTSRPDTVSAEAAANSSRRWKVIAFVSAVCTVLVLASYIAWPRLTQRAMQSPAQKGSILLGEFMNSTGDPVFDDTLRQGLSVQLEQSPFLNLVSDGQIHQTLRMMGQPAEAKLTPAIAQELCARTGSKAFLRGSIANLGSAYVIGLKAVDCTTGELLADAQSQAPSKEKVLDALSRAATDLRSKLGESLSTVRGFDTPLEQVTTPSLEALQAYSQGRKAVAENGEWYESALLFRRAVELDPSFAMAYEALGVDYENLGQVSLGAENRRKAYELRQRTSERERLYIESGYYLSGTGELQKALETQEMLVRVYPRDFASWNNLGTVTGRLGQWDRVLVAQRKAAELGMHAIVHAGLISAYMCLNRLDEARATAREVQAKNLDSPFLHYVLYQLAFMEEDPHGMAEQVAWASGKPVPERTLLELESDTAAFSGRLGKARELSRRALMLAEQQGEKEVAAGFEAQAAVREALYGNAAEARIRAAAALKLSENRDTKSGAALALAFAGGAAQPLADDLAKQFPQDTIVQFNYLPTLRAQFALQRAQASKAIEELRVASPFELGQVAFAFYPVYVRGNAFLAVREGDHAAAEFQKIVEWRGIVRNEPIGALAHLGLARAYAVQGDTAKALAAYNDFFTLWKDADPDIPILKQARREYARLNKD